MLANDTFRLVTAVALGLSGSAALAEVFTYRAHHYRPASAESCFAEAQSLRERFTAQTGFVTLGAGCEYDRVTERTDLLIRYESTERVAVVSTSLPQFYYEPNGFYADQEACEADLERQMRVFTEETGLEPFLSYCNSSRYLSPLPWSFRIEGFGETKRQPQRKSFRSSRPYAPSYSEINEEIRVGLEAREARLVSLAWRPYSPHEQATAFFYSSRDIKMDSAFVVGIHGLDECMAARQTLVAGVVAAPSVSYLTSFCASRYSNPKTFELTLAVVGEVPRIDYSVENFAKLDDCQQALPRMISEMQGLNGEAPIASFCGNPPYQSREIRAAFILRR